MSELRAYQVEAIDSLRRSLAGGSRAPLLVAPCGSGKTAIAADMIRSAREKSHQCLFLAPRRELIYQTAARLESVGIAHGVIMAGEEPSLMPGVQVASIPTLHARAIQRDAIDLPRAGLVLVDEAHIGVGGRAQQIIEHYQREAVVVGLTATPARSDGLGLGAIYDDLVCGPSVADLTGQGYLVASRYFAGAKPDTTGVKVQAGDYQQSALGERANETELVGDVVSNWFRLAGDRQTFVFAVNRAHSRHLCDRFREHGIAAEHIDGKTDLDDRKAIHGRLERGETQVVCNCQVYTYGVDYPPVSCIVLACPTKSIVKYHQMVGRGLRPSPATGKADCLVLDHAGIVLDEKLGFIDDAVPWSLDGRTKVAERKAAAERSKPDDMHCPECESLIRPAPRCPVCNHEMDQLYGRVIKAHEAELAEIDKRERKREQRRWSVEAKAAFHAELKAYARRKGYKPGWAAHKYRERLGCWPNDSRVRDVSAREPSDETLAWIRSRQIAFAKAKEQTV